MSIDKAIQVIEKFKGESLTKRLASIENEITGMDANASLDYCSTHEFNDDFIKSTLEIKKVAGQINVIMHAAGILHSLSTLLNEGEVVESVSLGAGNTGRAFDLETNQRVAEFKFIDWQGGAESIRQNGLFKDFYQLAEHTTKKQKCLYVVGMHYPLKFFNGSRLITSVLSKQPELLADLNTKYGNDVRVVRDYYQLHKDNVNICDVSPHIGRVG